MNYPLVSVGIPTFNRPKGLEKVINDFLNQTYINIEIIISDNNSDNPEVKRICKEFEQVDSRIKYFRQKENIGMYKNFEFVRDISRGEYFAWASDDDRFHHSFIKETFDIISKDDSIVLCTPLIKVFSGEKEIMQYKPDFHTVGLDKLNRIKKISNYIKEGHGALYGLYRSVELKKIKIHEYIDCDGLILFELSQYGSFFMHCEFLMEAQQGINNLECKSLTYQKKKLIDSYNMKPKWFLLNFEHKTLFVYFLIQLIKWKKISLIEKTILSKNLYHSFFGYSKFISIFKTTLFYFRKRKITCIININQNEFQQKKLEECLVYLTTVSYKILINLSNSQLENNEFKNIINQISLKYKNVIIHNRYFSNKTAELQYPRDYIKSNLNETTHVLLMDGDELFSMKKLKRITELLNYKKYFNRTLINNDSKILVYPNRDFVHFSTTGKISCGKLNVKI